MYAARALGIVVEVAGAAVVAGASAFELPPPQEATRTIASAISDTCTIRVSRVSRVMRTPSYRRRRAVRRGEPVGRFGDRADPASAGGGEEVAQAPREIDLGDGDMELAGQDRA